MILYIILSILVIYLVIVAYIKIRYRFWSIQPVFHIYNLFYWLWPCGIIQHEKPSITKFYDSKVVTKPFDDFSAEKKDLFYYLIKRHYLDDKKEKYDPPKYAVLDYFKAHNKSSHLSLRFEHLPHQKAPNERVSSTTKLVSAMSTRPLSGSFDGQAIDMQYVDFLCVHRNYRKKGFASRTIYSHYYNCRRQKAGHVYLFKREGILNLMVPLTVYYAYVFSLKDWKCPNINIPNSIVCHLITSGNFNLFAHYFGEIKDKFKCFIAPIVSHVKLLVEKKLLLICLVLDNTTPIGVYIFRRPFTKYDGKGSIECIASYFEVGYHDIFVDSFRNAIALINHVIPIDILIVENISNNNFVLKRIFKQSNTLWKCPMAYFLYNFSYYPFLSTDVFLLN